MTLAALTASQAAWWSAKVIKVLVAAGGPAALLPDVKLRENASGVGYVSGHAAVAFALATVLAPSLPRVASARVSRPRRQWRSGGSSGAHLPLDVVGGAGLGLLCGHARRDGRSVSAARASRVATRELGDAQIRPRRSSMWKLSHPGRIGNQ